MGVPMGVPLFKVRDTLKKHKVTLFSGNFRLYGDFSQRVVQILKNACPDVEVYSVDESFLELSRMNITDYTQWANTLREQIFTWTGIPVSVGIAPTKTLAKASAEFAKKNPDTTGVYSLIPDQNITDQQAATRHQQLLSWLPVGDVWGIGWRTAPKLHQRGISTAHDLVQVSDSWAQKQLSIRGLKTVKELQGEPYLEIEHEEPQQSIARTRSFGHTVRNYHELEGAVATFTAQAAAKLREQDEVASGVVVFLRTSHKSTEYRGGSIAIPLLQPNADTGSLIEAALQALEQIYDPDFGYKKAGVILVGLKSTQSWQLSLLQGTPEDLDRQAHLMQTVDQINQRHGTRLVRHANEFAGNQAWKSKRQRQSPAYTTDWAAIPHVQ